MKASRVQEAIRVLKSSVEDAPTDRKIRTKKDARSVKVKKAAKVKD